MVGVDGSEPGLRAVDWASDEAALRGLPLRLVHASAGGNSLTSSLGAALPPPAVHGARRGQGG
ncbi:universal stress protein [Streptomyces sp. NPDC057253]|uniref:universal stress protein n=1 Tax=Streptomyces sp. NPDC057253 TaxID=3346069 RepID=UPI0036331887